ncbi:hypothetical protein ALC53_02708, partial [Atta colombica]
TNSYNIKIKILPDFTILLKQSTLLNIVGMLPSFNVKYFSPTLRKQMMNSDDIDKNIISLYNAQKWEEVAALSSASDNLKSRLDVVGIELDSSWWHSKYSPPQFLKNIIFVENKSVNFQVPKRYAMLFCYFNNCIAFCNYMESYKGNLIFVIGPAQGNNCTTDPLPFDEKFKKYNWKLIKQKRLVCSNNYIVAYSNK